MRTRLSSEAAAAPSSQAAATGSSDAAAPSTSGRDSQQEPRLTFYIRGTPLRNNSTIFQVHTLAAAVAAGDVTLAICCHSEQCVQIQHALCSITWPHDVLANPFAPFACQLGPDDYLNREPTLPVQVVIGSQLTCTSACKLVYACMTGVSHCLAAHCVIDNVSEASFATAGSPADRAGSS